MNTKPSQEKLWVCKNCSICNGDGGPWKEDSDLFKIIKFDHRDCPGFQKILLEKADFKKERIVKDGLQEGIDHVVSVFQNAHLRTKEREKLRGLPIHQIESYLNSIIKNESLLVRKLLRVFLSGYTNNPINLGILSPSSEGKTYPIVIVSEIFPKNDVISIGRMSPTALIHQHGCLINSHGNSIEEKLAELDFLHPKDEKERSEIRKKRKNLLQGSKNLIDLRCKILLFLEPPNQHLWDILKPILSHDKYEIEYKTTQTDGSLRVKETIIRGWPAVVFCSAKNEAHNKIWEEIQTRFDLVSPNTSISKYKEANKHTALTMGIPNFAKNMVVNLEDEKYANYYVEKLKEKITSLYKNNNPIWNPFNQIIAKTFPHTEGITMRQCKRFLSYCNIESLINYDENYKIFFKNKNGEKETFVIISLTDIETVIEMIGTLSSIPDEKLNFLKDVFEPLNQDNEGVTSDIIAEEYTKKYGKTTSPKKILENYLNPLCDLGILNFTDNPSDKRQHLFNIASKPNTNNLLIIRDKIIEESNNDDLFVWKAIIELEKHSIENGKIEVIVDPEGLPEGHNLIQKNIVISSLKSNTSRVVQA